MKRVVVCGAGGFIGSQLVSKLKDEGAFVRAVDLKPPEFGVSCADDFIVGDLRDFSVCERIFSEAFDEVYQLAADMGGAGYLFTGDNDADVMHNSALINLNVLESCKRRRINHVFFSSSACVYPEHNQLDPNNPICAEDSVYPASPDSEYGWEKLFSERLYLAYGRNQSMQIRIGRYHNIFGPMGTWQGGREKVPAALCRKVASAQDRTYIDIWGDGEQTRSFLFIEDCLEATVRMMRGEWAGPVNIGSDEMVSINELAGMIIEISGKDLTLRHIEGPLGVRGRNSDNTLMKQKLGWTHSVPLRAGLEMTYEWVKEQVSAEKCSQ